MAFVEDSTTLSAYLNDFSQPIKFINVDASLLPRWRGAAPILRSIINMDLETGLSIMKIVSKLEPNQGIARFSYLNYDTFGVLQGFSRAHHSTPQ